MHACVVRVCVCVQGFLFWGVFFENALLSSAQLSSHRGACGHRGSRGRGQRTGQGGPQLPPLVSGDGVRWTLCSGLFRFNPSPGEKMVEGELVSEASAGTGGSRSSSESQDPRPECNGGHTYLPSVPTKQN